VTAIVESQENGTSLVRVAIDAAGDESAVGWSINFNPGDWHFVGASDAVQGAELALNTALIESGRLGLAILLKREPRSTKARSNWLSCTSSRRARRVERWPLVLRIGRFRAR
jgi:hypothetical protein